MGGSAAWASAFGSDHDPKVLGLSPVWGSVLMGESAAPSLSPPPALFSLSQINIENLVFSFLKEGSDYNYFKWLN